MIKKNKPYPLPIQEGPGFFKKRRVQGTDYRLISFFNRYFKTLEKCSYILSLLFNKKIHLDIVRLHLPFHSSDILAQILGQPTNSNKYRFSRMIQKLLPRAVIKNPSLTESREGILKKSQILPSYLSGLNIKLAGRLMSQRVIPRYTVQNRQEGSLARGKVNFVEKSRFTNKNKRGAYSFTVNISHIV